MDKVSTLRDVAQAAAERHGSGRQLDRAAKGLHLRMSYTTVNKMLAGTYLSDPDRNTLDALSVLSGVPRADVYRAAGQPLPLAPLADVLPQDADLLTAAQRRVVLGVIREFAKAERSKHERKTSDKTAKPTNTKGRGVPAESPTSEAPTLQSTGASPPPSSDPPETARP